MHVFSFRPPLQLSLAISYEMIRNPTKAKLIYSSAHDDLETTITMLAQDTDSESIT